MARISAPYERVEPSSSVTVRAAVSSFATGLPSTSSTFCSAYHSGPRSGIHSGGALPAR